MITTQFFGAKLQRYMHDHDIPIDDAGAGRGEGVRERLAHAARVAAEAAVRRGDPRLADARASAHAVHALLAGRGRGRARRLPPRVPRAGCRTRVRVWLRSASFRTRRAGSFEVFSPSLGLEIARLADGRRRAARRSRQAGVEPKDVDVAQVQDTESGAELIHLAECGLCEHGEQTELYARGATRIDGDLPVNTDGGCLANGEPVGASGLRQVYEVVAQLRGEAGERQVPGDPQGRLHAGLRCAGRQRLHGGVPLVRLSLNEAELRIRDETRAFLAEHLPAARRGPGRLRRACRVPARAGSASCTTRAS